MEISPVGPGRWMDDRGSYPERPAHLRRLDRMSQLWGGVVQVILGTFCVLGAESIEQEDLSTLIASWFVTMGGAGMFAMGSYNVIKGAWPVQTEKAYRTIMWQLKWKRKHNEQMRRLDAIIAGFGDSK